MRKSEGDIGRICTMDSVGRRCCDEQSEQPKNVCLSGECMDFETAKLVADTLEDINRRVFALLEPLQRRCSPAEFKVLKREIARVSTGIDLNFYPLIVKQYPELDPLKDRR